MDTIAVIDLVGVVADLVLTYTEPGLQEIAQLGGIVAL